MAEKKQIKLKSLSADELAGIISLYPWFGAARKELCERMARTSGSEWGIRHYVDSAMYVADRTIIHNILRSTRKEDYSDKDVRKLIKEYVVERSAMAAHEAAENAPAGAIAGYKRTVRPAGGDFFSADQYRNARQDGDDFFSKFKAERNDGPEEKSWEDPELGFCTETLAQIYAEQGYSEHARKIYSRLILRYPEKSAYFASLIEKLQPEN